jgi:hypothetical protein
VVLFISLECINPFGSTVCGSIPPPLCGKTLYNTVLLKISFQKQFKMCTVRQLVAFRHTKFAAYFVL